MMKKLGLVLTKGMSIQSWIDTGLFDREISIYKNYLSEGFFDEIVIFSYGSSDVIGFDKRFFIVTKPKFLRGKLGDWIYSFIWPFIQKKNIKNVDVFKSNQLLGAWALVLVKFFYKKNYLLRTGYTFSLFLKQRGYKGVKLKLFELLEYVTFKFSSHATCASEQDKRYLINKYHFLNNNNLSVQKNYIDTEKYLCSLPLSSRKDSLCFVGRFNIQKNLVNLLNGYKQSGVSSQLIIAGHGEMEKEIKDIINSLNIQDKVILLGKLSNDEVANLLRTSSYYILPSLFEGMPKTLLEAMASGCLCIATDVPGNNEVIEHGVNGFLIDDTSAEEISKSLKRYCTYYDTKNEDIANKAITYIKREHSMKSYVIKEYKRLQSVYSH